MDFETCFKTSAFAAVAVDESDRIVFFNDGAALIWGLSADEVIGRDLAVLLPPALSPHHSIYTFRHRETSINRIVGGTRVVEIERTDGEHVTVRLSLSSYETGRGRGYFAIAFDITDDQAQRTLTEQTIENAVDAVVVIDGGNCIRWFNRSAENLWRFQRREVLGKNVKILVPPEIRPMHDAMIAANRVTGVGKIVGSAREVEMVRADGERFIASLALSRIQLGVEVYYAAFVRDVTELARARTLQIEFAALKERFSTFLTHEMRTPLAILDGGIRRARRKLAKGDLSLAETLDELERSVRRMTRLSDDALTASRAIEGGVKANTTDISPEALITLVCAQRREINDSHAIELSIQSALPAVMPLDETLMHSAIDNLLSNAIKYSPDADRIEVHAQHADGALVIAVRDFGRGVPAEELDCLFHRFFRATTSSGIAGAGVGLALVKSIAEAHDGSITVQSEVGRGSVFTLTIPVPQNAVPASEPENPARSGKRAESRRRTAALAGDPG
jgi:PAS domain S-box-containing protein